MREKMPLCAAFVDELREVFGVGEMNHVMRTGLRPDCDPRLRVHFVEAGHELGAPAGVLGVEVRPTLLPPLSVLMPTRGRK